MALHLHNPSHAVKVNFVRGFAMFALLISGVVFLCNTRVFQIPLIPWNPALGFSLIFAALVVPVLGGLPQGNRH